MTTTSAPRVDDPPPGATPSPLSPRPPWPTPRVLPSAVVGVIGLAAVLTLVDLATDLGLVAWGVGSGCGLVLTLLLSRSLVRAGHVRLTPADVVTLSRGLLTCALAALVAETLPGAPQRVTFVVLAVPALALDAVDGAVARRTRTASAVGGRLDGETDAFLVLVLSIAAGPVVGWWVMAAGAARYLFGAAGVLLPWLRRPLPFRYWRKVVTAVVGVTLAVGACDLLPRGVATAVTVGALGLLGESFGRDVWWSWRRRSASPGRVRPRHVAVLRGIAVGGGSVLGWCALLAPTRPDRLTVVAFLRLPLESLVLVALLLVAPVVLRRPLAEVAGVLAGMLALAKVLDLGAMFALDRPFDVVTDLGALGSGLAFLDDAVGTWAAASAVLAALVLVGLLVLGLPRAVADLATVLARRRRRSAAVLLGLAVVWGLAALTGLRVAPGVPLAAADTGPYVVGAVRAASTAVRARTAFAAALADDRFADPAAADLTALRGKDVLVVFVESYGRTALDGGPAGPVRDLLDEYTARFAAHGWSARSAFLTSPTVGGYSWLAHATLQSGLDVDEQSQYDRLLRSDRVTLTSAFARRGWRTVAVLPSTHGSWPEGRAFYRFDRVRGMSDLGYAGPSFGFSGMPDQFALAALDRLELGPSHRPVMAEVELTSSHSPWAPLPTTVDPETLGDGSVFVGAHARARSAGDLWRHRTQVPAAYRASILYSLTSVLDFVERHDDLVLLVLGDHEPSSVVRGFGGDREVPVTIVAQDPAVLARVASWGWDPGLRPSDGTPVWPMAAVRDRFLTAFSGPARP